MTVYEILEQSDLIDWPVILVGWTERYVSRKNVIDWSVSWLTQHESEDCESIIALAGAEHDSDADIEIWLTAAAELKAGFNIKDSNAYALEKEKWRLAFLKSLQKERISDAEKINKLQELYARFDYPEDMQRCSKYGASDFAIEKGNAVQQYIDPLEALADVITQLESRHVPKNH